MPVPIILLGLFDEISKVNSAWSVAAFTATALLLALKFAGVGKRSKPTTSIIILCIILMFLIGLAPIVASKIAVKPPAPYKIITEVRDSSNLIYDAADLVVYNSLKIPISRINNGWQLTVNSDELTSDSMVAITAQTANKLLFGATQVRITGSLNYAVTIVLNRTNLRPPDTGKGLPAHLPKPKTFSLNFGSTGLAEKISKQTKLTYTAQLANYKIAVSYDPEKLTSDGNGLYQLDECNPIITINGARCSGVQCCRIIGTGFTTKSIIESYINDRLRASAEKCYQEQINNIIECLRQK